MSTPSTKHSTGRERGAVLIVALVFLVIMTVLGVTAMRTTTLQERMAGNVRDSNLAFQSAEAALREGEQFLQQATLPPFNGANGLLPMEEDAGQVTFWNAYAWNGNGRVTASVAGVIEAPRYVIEELPALPAEGDSAKFGALPDVGFYRVTARAAGGTQDAVSILQTTYRR
jgi:type IV pilus assembly protein PilX